jgi:hypothetical protein
MDDSAVAGVSYPTGAIQRVDGQGLRRGEAAARPKLGSIGADVDDRAVPGISDPT